MSSCAFKTRPNILLIIVDQERFPPAYEESSLRTWREEALPAHSFLRRHGMEFKRHYAGATACSPSRTTLFTGQYPSLHGVTQTSGVAKLSPDSDMFWLDPNTVPTMGDYFRAAGYRTYYKGKWHISDGDIWIPGTHVPVLSYDSVTGIPDLQKESLYWLADRLDGYGFSGWIGPEPHGRAPHNSGSSAAIGVNGRDVVYGSEMIHLLFWLEQEKQQLAHPDEYQPWFVVASFVNPHDIALYGDISAQVPLFRFHVDDSIPDIPPSPTQNESLLTKPRCQASYRDVYPQAFQPISDDDFYRRLYFQLQKNADQQVMRVLQALTATSFYPETLVVFTADHGELLGAHGNLHQKWYCAYEEAIHIPLIIHNPLLFPQSLSTEMLTSHVDILPTLLGCVQADVPALAEQLQLTHSETRPFVGNNFSSLIVSGGEIQPDDFGPLYFMSEDDVTKGQHQVSLLGQPYHSVIEPNLLESVIAYLPTDGHWELWKYSRYFAAPSAPGQPPPPIEPEYELYNLTTDPWEMHNLAFPALSTPYVEQVRTQLELLLNEQRQAKRLTPFSTVDNQTKKLPG
ncbi:sulfatase-like hydrolase/transferase [Brevibacillus sp. 1238]|uniref:sulfatase-like hydrolase/transferase n=1 Tax=Brevibacillus sp. 1238 TaxID=2940565 RepID=UPI002475E5F2|nr:sulfatase-like hydrolase/transferase [Brevibacillus sp. 1238]MDH6351113.1 arylsulfatase A-like enzyme [Brevibacillus sp. 1238]